MGWFDGFAEGRYPGAGAEVFARVGGPPHAPPLLLLHGFPQTHAMWHRVATRLTADFRLVLPDLRGYGDSGRPDVSQDAGQDGTAHAGYTKRAMAADLVALMGHLGHDTFAVAGHDRGGRVAHRLALDHPQALTRLAVLDIAPTYDMYAATDRAFATAYYHWFHLIQPEPLPETMIGGAPREYLHRKLGGWGGDGLAAFEARALTEYERCFTPAAIHAMCEDYRASASVDLDHDRASRAAGERIRCDLLALIGDRGVVARLFDADALWRAQCAGTVTTTLLPSGHHIPEEQPEATAQALAAFFGAG